MQLLFPSLYYTRLCRTVRRNGSPTVDAPIFVARRVLPQSIAHLRLVGQSTLCIGLVRCAWPGCNMCMGSAFRNNTNVIRAPYAPVRVRDTRHRRVHRSTQTLLHQEPSRSHRTCTGRIRDPLWRVKGRGRRETPVPRPITVVATERRAAPTPCPDVVVDT